MKTPMQEVYENFNLMSDADFKAWMLNTDLLEKEKEVMCQFQSDGQNTDFLVKYEDNEDCFNKTFKNKER